ncbi:hypothetical protein TELCIR_14226, partial [Teladorsagia circumcincta]
YWSCIRAFIVMKRLVLFHIIQTYIPTGRDGGPDDEKGRDSPSANDDDDLQDEDRTRNDDATEYPFSLCGAALIAENTRVWFEREAENTALMSATPHAAAHIYSKFDFTKPCQRFLLDPESPPIIALCIVIESLSGTEECWDKEKPVVISRIMWRRRDATTCMKKLMVR